MYKARFAVGSTVRVAPLAMLQRHKSAWRYHHPLNEGQLRFAEVKTVVESVSFYHGGDALYELESVPGIWHEICITSCDEQNHEGS